MSSKWDKYEGIDFPPPYAPPEPIDCMTLPTQDQVFTQVMPGGKNVVYAVSRIREHCLRTFHPLVLTVLRVDHAQLILKERGLESDRLGRAMLRTPYYKPLLYLHQADGSHLLADGSHTYVARMMLGHRQALAYLVESYIWEHFLVSGFPTETMDEAALLASHSRIKV